MKVLVEVPESLAERLGGSPADLSRAVLEALAVDAYRQDRIAKVELQELLGIESFYEMETFLKQHKVPLEYSIADFEADTETSRRLREERHL
jgi:chromosome segregation and condensation protein ScpB